MARVKKTREQVIETLKEMYSWFDQPCDMIEEEFIKEMLPLSAFASTKEIADAQLSQARLRTRHIRTNIGSYRAKAQERK